MRSFPLLAMVIGPLLTQGCVPSNLPFIPPYDVELDIQDPAAAGSDPTLQGQFTKGTVEVITTVGACAVQLKLGQCKDGEEVWFNIKAAPVDPECRNHCVCEPAVWTRLQGAVGGTLPLAAAMEDTRSQGVVLEVLAGAMEDTNGNGVVDKHSSENRIAVQFTGGSLSVYAADDEKALASGLVEQGRFLADLDAKGPEGSWVRGSVDGVVNAQDGMPVGPRCSWTPAFLAEDN